MPRWLTNRRGLASPIPRALVLAGLIALLMLAHVDTAFAAPASEGRDPAPSSRPSAEAFGPHVHSLAADAYATAGLGKSRDTPARTDLLRAALRAAPSRGGGALRREPDARFTWTLPESMRIQAEPWAVEKNFWLAATEVVLIQAIPWSVNAFAKDEDWAKGIGVESWLNNLVNGWEWDDNQFVNNQFSHPYHGNLYFNAARCSSTGCSARGR